MNLKHFIENGQLDLSAKFGINVEYKFIFSSKINNFNLSQVFFFKYANAYIYRDSNKRSDDIGVKYSLRFFMKSTVIHVNGLHFFDVSSYLIRRYSHLIISIQHTSNRKKCLSVRRRRAHAHQNHFLLTSSNEFFISKTYSL